MSYKLFWICHFNGNTLRYLYQIYQYWPIFSRSFEFNLLFKRFTKCNSRKLCLFIAAIWGFSLLSNVKRLTHSSFEVRKNYWIIPPGTLNVFWSLWMITELTQIKKFSRRVLFKMVHLRKILFIESRGSRKFWNNKEVSDFVFRHFLKKKVSATIYE